MSIYSNVTEQDLINLRKLAKQQKNQRAEKIKNRNLKETHDKKLAESLSPITEPITERLDKVNESTEKLGDVIKESQPKTPQLAIENSPQPAIENNQDETQPQLPMENDQDDTQPGILYDVSLENTLTNMKDKQKGFFKIIEDQNRQRFWNGIPVEISGDSRIEIKGSDFNITPNLQKVFTDTTGKSLKKLDKTENITYKKLLKTLNYNNYKPKSGEISSGRYKNTKDILKPINLQGRGIEKKIIPSNIIDIYTRLEILLGLKLSGHTDTLTEASNLIDDIYKRGEIQTKQQYRNALYKFSNQ